MTEPATSGYVPVNGLRMYYEVHGPDSSDRAPLVLLHGALSATETSFGALLPALAADRRVIAVEQQAHGRTPDADRPLRDAQMAGDTAALLDHLSLRGVDLMGYSMGAGVALQVAHQRAELVHKLVLISLVTQVGGFQEGVLEAIELLTPEMLEGTPFAAEFARLAPDPAAWPQTIERVKEWDANFVPTPPEVVRGIAAPALLVTGDADIVRPEHTAELYGLLGGGMADARGKLPRSQMCVVPGASHISVVSRADVLLSVIPTFLDAPL
jgi:pimeloyl-ACP methyl ester carboxylesterase